MAHGPSYEWKRPYRLDEPSLHSSRRDPLADLDETARLVDRTMQFIAEALEADGHSTAGYNSDHAAALVGILRLYIESCRTGADAPAPGSGRPTGLLVF